ncbi:hypothetical protein LX64_04294 [Chitinophaga skermanii]|uniref:Uncharacterized protein n=1 Tax=Chitinophaga skermanii TaxID=331697 RepID=A0A327Q904_9BACT|nr:hypothetical protein [Chitinophaga skermanii]RAI99742.1 hypothetical protein LX64_04294 [Chitinophaga skermanii]
MLELLKNSYLCYTMKSIIHITKSLSLSCLLAGILILTGFKAQANESVLPDDNKDKIAKKVDDRLFMPKTNLSMDAGFKTSGMINSAFKLSSTYAPEPQVTTPAFKKGNFTFVLPANFQMQQTAPVDIQKYHKVQISIPLRRG